MLGLVMTKTSRVETLDQIAGRLRDAASLVGADRLALSPQCGFATLVAGNTIAPEAQHAKLAVLVHAAHGRPRLCAHSQLRGRAGHR